MKAPEERFMLVSAMSHATTEFESVVHMTAGKSDSVPPDYTGEDVWNNVYEEEYELLIRDVTDFIFGREDVPPQDHTASEMMMEVKELAWEHGNQVVDSYLDNMETHA